MKKSLLAFALAVTFGLSAQPVLEVTLDSPQQGATLNSGGTLQWDITVSNTGNALHNSPANGDTCIYYPTINGSLISVGGQTQAFIIADPIPASQSVTRTRSYIISGGTGGNWNVCGRILVSGNSYTGTAQDSSCVDITYNAMSVGEFVVAKYVDDSYYTNGMYNIKITAADEMNQPTFEMVDISGRTVKQQVLETDGETIDQGINISDLPAGIYIVRLQTQSDVISINKIIKR